MKKSVLHLVTLCVAGGVGLSVQAAPTHLVDEKPVKITEVADGVILIDFGKVAYGNIRLTPASDVSGEVTLHFGEDFVNGRVNRKPKGTVRYNKATVTLSGGQPVVAAPPADVRNTELVSKRKYYHPPAILTPPEWGVVLPFRWLEIEGWKGELKAEQIVRQSAYASTWNDDAAAFESSDDMLNKIWDLCSYSIKATTFAGVYVDGDRERIPYEADAYLNQLSHYYTDDDKVMARDTINYMLLEGIGTWPTEWAPHLVFMVYADWMHTGDLGWMSGRYQALKSKLNRHRLGDDGLIYSSAEDMKRTDIVDWPKKERDGYVFTERNTVVNAFYLRSLVLMAEMARVIGFTDEAKQFEADYNASYTAFQKTFFDADKGLYRDGIGTDHISSHANLYPLAFGLVPEEHREKMADWLADRGMRCSVYAAQYLMEGLFENGAGTKALDLILADGDRSWKHMVKSGTTISWEAWDLKYKPNQDWNHAWGAAPANLLPRYVLGAEPLVPGWKTARISPNVGNLKSAEGKVPTRLGSILVEWKNEKSFRIKLQLPEGMDAQVDLPKVGKSNEVLLNGEPIEASVQGGRLRLKKTVVGSVVLEVK
ncbi:family 78 glycoside hydrolase catalytic domain [Pontiellaceae bacterium B12227]|nr:family 78 glycoside hydrolase catalytic domain [Pontiellaceae bacterium B12227]